MVEYFPRYSFLGVLAILNLTSRPIPAAREWLRMESQVGRYSHHNLLSLSWAETALQYFQDNNLELVEYVISDLLRADPFVTSI